MAHLWNVRISFHRCAFLFIYIESRHGFGNEFYLWYEHDVLLHDGFPVLSYVFVGYDDYSVLQFCIDGPGEARLVQMAESFNAGIAFPLVAGVLYFYP